MLYLNSWMRLAGLASLAAIATFSQATITVPTDQPTIQAAINAAIPGEDIIVLPGTYAEGRIEVTKSVFLHGPNNGVTPSQVRSTEAHVVGGFVILSSGVSIQGFEIDGGTLDGVFTYGVRSSQANALLTVSYNWIHSLPSGAGGVDLGDDFGVRTSDWVVSYNTINNSTPGAITGIYLRGAERADVRGNEIALQPANDYGFPGIVLDGVWDANVTLNDIDCGQLTANISSASYGIGLQAFLESVARVNVSENVVRNSVAGVLSTGNLYSVQDVTISKNDLEGLFYGISMQGFVAGSNTISHERIAVTHNRLAAGSSTNSGGCAFIGAGGTMEYSDVVFRKNSFEPLPGSGLVFGVAVTNSAIIPTYKGQVDARMNYWNSPTGPSAVGTGSGLRVTNRVDFRKWLTSWP